MLEDFKNLKEISNLSIKTLKNTGYLTDENIDKIISFDKFDFEKYIEELNCNHVNLLQANNYIYPENLKSIYNFPKVLYYAGNTNILASKMVAIVGSRDATSEGLKISYNIAHELAKNGVTIVSGLARGIDTYAHVGALKACGATVAVLGNGIDVAYPYQNRKLQERIKEKGLVLSEYFLGAKPEKYHFPQRNRIISGLVDFVLVVEAKEKSGSLITAEIALEEGRNVGAVPGSTYSECSYGTNLLIKQGAYLIRNASDILELL